MECHLKGHKREEITYENMGDVKRVYGGKTS